MIISTKVKQLRKAGKKIAAQISSRMGFSESKNLVFMKENAIFAIEVRVQKDGETFWNIFCLWKVNYAITVEETKAYVE